MKLYNNTKQVWLATELAVAESFLSRLVGLLGRKSLADDQGLLISPCDSIHTFGMLFSIDAVFIDREYKVVKVCEAVKPFRVIMPVKRAKSVIELPAHSVAKKPIEMGDQLQVTG
jgi:hypothetical protein